MPTVPYQFLLMCSSAWCMELIIFPLTLTDSSGKLSYRAWSLDKETLWSCSERFFRDETCSCISCLDSFQVLSWFLADFTTLPYFTWTSPCAQRGIPFLYPLSGLCQNGGRKWAGNVTRSMEKSPGSRTSYVGVTHRWSGLRKGSILVRYWSLFCFIARFAAVNSVNLIRCGSIALL